MALLRSWLRQPMANSTMNHETEISPPSPTSQDAAASTLIPPPTASRTLQTSKSQGHKLGPNDSHMSALRSSERRLQRHLQWYLDAQADGLLSGIASEEISGTGRVNLRSLHFQEHGRQPARQKSCETIGLGTARTGILSTMKSLASVKAEERQHFSSLATEVDAELQKIYAWEEKHNDLENRLNQVASSAQGSSILSLQQEDLALQDQIEAMESKLAELKSQQRAVRLQLSRARNSVDSMSSSYKASLSLLDSEVHQFLKSPPRFEGSFVSSAALLESLPLDRRSLALAKDYLREALEIGNTHEAESEKERQALLEGAKIWKDVIADVTEFEALLRQEMSGPGPTASTANSQMEDTRRSQDAIRKLLDRMSLVISHLQHAFNDAELSGWSLLVCCLGAELEAFQRGHQILQQALQLSERGRPNVSQGHSADTNDFRDVALGPLGTPTSSRVLECLPQKDDEDEQDLDPDSLLVSQ